jgi:hypothetical protein
LEENRECEGANFMSNLNLRRITKGFYPSLSILDTFNLKNLTSAKNQLNIKTLNFYAEFKSVEEVPKISKLVVGNFFGDQYDKRKKSVFL